MRTLLVVLGAMAVLVGVATQPASAGKGTDFDRFVKQVEKFAVNNTLLKKPKGLCVCQDGSGNHGLSGALIYSGSLGDPDVSVHCYAYQFASAGDLTATFTCDTFEVLSK